MIMKRIITILNVVRCVRIVDVEEVEEATVTTAARPSADWHPPYRTPAYWA